MKSIGLLYNPRSSATRPLGEAISAWLAERGRSTWLISTLDAPPEPARLRQTELVITLGGDGTLLRAVALVLPYDIPLLGLNLGRVGFLTEGGPESWPHLLEDYLAGRGRLERRGTLAVRALSQRKFGSEREAVALNEAVVGRGPLARTIRLEVQIDGVPLTDYVADGLIVATATGSTAYAYAVGGPILPPWMDALILVPVAPHLCLERPLILDEKTVIEITVRSRRGGMLTVDGRLVAELRDGDRVQLFRHHQPALFWRMRDRLDFYRTLIERLRPRTLAETGR